MVGRQYGGYVQSGRGDFPVFRGSRMQRGYGLGSILSGMFRTAIPFLKSGAKALGKQALRTGVSIGQDVLSGQNLKTAARRRALETLRQQKSKGRSTSATGKKKPKPPAGVKGIKRKAGGKSVSSSRGGKVKRRQRSPDIFDG